MAVGVEFWMWLIVLIALVLGIAQLVIIFRAAPAEESKKREQKANSEFYKELKRRIDLGVISSLDDVALIQRSIAFASGELVSLLEGYLLTVADKDEFRLIQELLDRERTEKPFSILPDRERGIAEALNRAIESQQRDFAVTQLQELTTSLGTKLRAAYDEVNSTRKWGRYGVYGTIAGFLLALVFGVVAVLT